MRDEVKPQFEQFKAAVLAELDKIEKEAQDPHAIFTWVPHHDGTRNTHNLSCAPEVVKAGRDLVSMGMSKILGVAAEDLETSIFNLAEKKPTGPPMGKGGLA